MATDYHASCVTAVTSVFGAALIAAGYPAADLPCVATDDIETAAKQNALPVVVVCPVGPEQDRADWGTNQSDGVGYPVAVALLATGVVGGAQGETGTPEDPPTPAVPDLSPTLFLRLVRITFGNKRLSGVTQVGVCEVSQNPVPFDKDSPAFNKIQTAATVVCVGRFPRS